MAEVSQVISIGGAACCEALGDAAKGEGLGGEGRGNWGGGNRGRTRGGVGSVCGGGEGGHPGGVGGGGRVDGEGGVVDHLVGGCPCLGVGVGQVIDVARRKGRLQGRLLEAPALLPVRSGCLVDDRPLRISKLWKQELVASPCQAEDDDCQQEQDHRHQPNHKTQENLLPNTLLCSCLHLNHTEVGRLVVEASSSVCGKANVETGILGGDPVNDQGVQVVALGQVSNYFQS